MAITDRPMFRGAASPQQAAQATAQAKQGINDVMQSLNNEIDGAQNYEQVMNAIRGDEASVPERRAELAGIVGRDDAMQTPESVLTLVQPVVEMSTVDQGIGQLAQQQMQGEVSGPMAGGIMDMPVQKFQEAGAVKQATSAQLPELKTLKEYYDETLPAIQAIYGGSDARDMARGAALFGIADRGLRLAAGQSPAEAFAGIGQDLAQQAAGVSKAEQAIKAAALQQAGTDRAADRKLSGELIAKNLENQRKLAEQTPNSYIVTKDVTINVPQADGTTKPTLVPMRTMLSFTPADYAKLKANYPSLAQSLVSATDKQKENLLGQRTVLFPKAVTFNGLEYQPGTPYQVDISDIPEIEKLVGAPLIDGSDALNALLKTDTQTNYQVIDPEGITINGKSYKQGDTVALLPKTANLFEGRLAAAGAIDTQKVGPGQKQENYRVLAPNGVNIDGRTIASGDEVMLTAAQAASVPVGSLQLVEKAKTLKAFVPEDNLLYDKDGTISIFPDRAAYETAIASGNFTKDNQNKRFSTPQSLYKWDGQTNEVRPTMNPKEVKTAVADGFTTEKYTPQNDVRFKPNGEATVFDTKKPGALGTAISGGFTLTSAPTFDPKILYNVATGKADVARTAEDFVDMVKNQGFTNIAPPVVKGVNYDNDNNPMPYDNELQRRAAIENGFIYSNPDRPGEFKPETRFNDAGEKVVSRTLQEFGDNMAKGFYLTEKPEPGKITPASSRRTLLTLQKPISDGTASPEQISEFQMAISVIQGNPRLIYDGKEFKAVGGAIPPTVIDAVRSAKAKDPTFDDMGLLAEPAVEYTPDFPTLIQPGVDYAEALGGSGRFKQVIGRTADFLATFTPDFISSKTPAALSSILTQRDTRAAADDIFSLNTITITRSLGSIAGKENATLIARIEALQPDPYAFFTDPAGAKSKVENMIVQLEAVVESSKKIQSGSAYTQTQRTQAAEDVADIEFLISQYRELASGLQVKGGLIDPKDYIR